MFPPNPSVGAVLTNLIRPSLGEASPGHTVIAAIHITQTGQYIAI